MRRDVSALIVFVLATSIAASANAQVTWSAGFKGGVDFAPFLGSDTKISESVFDENTGSTLTFDGDLDGSRTGFAGGGFATAHINEAFGVQLEVLYVQKGGKGDIAVTVDGVPAGTLKATVKLDYVEIPLLGVGSFKAGEKATIDLFAGPAVAFNVSAKEKDEFLGETDETDVSDAFKSTDFGLAFGGGVTIAAHPRANVVLEGRYTLGLIKIAESDADLKTSAFSIMAGVSFPIGAGGGSGGGS